MIFRNSGNRALKISLFLAVAPVLFGLHSARAGYESRSRGSASGAMNSNATENNSYNNDGYGNSYDERILGAVIFKKATNLKKPCQFSCEIRTVAIYGNGWVTESRREISNSCGSHGIANFSQKQGRPVIQKAARLKTFARSTLLEGLRTIQSDLRLAARTSGKGHSAQPLPPEGAAECWTPNEVIVALTPEDSGGAEKIAELPSSSLIGAKGEEYWSRDIRNALQILNSRGAK